MAVVQDLTSWIVIGTPIFMHSQARTRSLTLMSLIIVPSKLSVFIKCHSNLSFACECCFACQLYQKIYLAACAVGIVLLALLYSYVLDPTRNCCTYVWRK
jgi:hypothetical protein